MMPLIVIGLLIGLPLFFTFVLRVNAAIVFLALCTGSVLAQFVGNDAIQIANSFFPQSSEDLIFSAVELTLLLLPAVLTIIFMRRSMSGSKTLVNILPAVASGLLTAVLVVPMLPPGTSHNVMQSDVWSTIEQFQSVIIGAGAFVSLMVLWGTKPKHGKHGKKGKHHK